MTAVDLGDFPGDYRGISASVSRAACEVGVAGLSGRDPG